MDEDDFIECARHDYEATEGDVDERLPLVAPFDQSYAGLERYWRKKREREVA
jgi:hypothetical protein